ncbi:MAG: CvpA family protein, partial [Desulfovibrio sp.]|nr:CvpA family protein [Desulfovibrio sp.]
MGSDIFDLIIILLLVFFSLRGLKNGFIGEIAGIVALVGGFVAANTLHPKVSPYLESLSDPTVRTILTYVIIFIAVMLLVSVLARLLRKLLELSFAKWIDNLAGFLLGLAKGIFLCSLIIMVVQAVFGNAPFLQDSHTIPYLNTLIEKVKEWMPADLISRLGFPL